MTQGPSPSRIRPLQLLVPRHTANGVPCGVTRIMGNLPYTVGPFLSGPAGGFPFQLGVPKFTVGEERGGGRS